MHPFFNESNSLSSWYMIKGKLAEMLPAEEFEKWLAPLAVKSDSNGGVRVQMPNTLFYQDFIANYLDKIDMAKSMLGIESIQINFEIGGDSQTENQIISMPFDSKKTSDTTNTSDTSKMPSLEPPNRRCLWIRPKEMPYREH